MIDINMPQSVMAAWLNALRSGNFKRGKEYLKFERDDEEPTFCCLGVLNEVTGIDAGCNDEELLFDDTFGLSRGLQSWLAEINDTTACIHRTVDDGVMIPSNDVLVPNANKFPNSSCRAPEGLPPFKVDWSKINTFEQIADYIEANLNPIGKETP